MRVIEYARAATLILKTIPAHRDYSMSLNAEQGSNSKAVSGFLPFLLAESAGDISFASIARPDLRILRDARALTPRILSSNLSPSLSNHPAIPSFSFSVSFSNICIRSHQFIPPAPNGDDILDKLPEDIKRMILAARKYNLKFTGLSISKDVKLGMSIWKHPAVNKGEHRRACRRDSATCLRLNHEVCKVEDALVMATRRTLTPRRPHQANPSGIGRKNCDCLLCYRDRTQLGCENPGAWCSIKPQLNCH
jgi:hypothetical protein